MQKKSKAIAPVLVVLLVAAGLLGGTALGFEFREPIKKAILGKTTTEEIKLAVESELQKLQAGKSKFELEGTAASVDVNSKTIVVKIKSSTSSIKELRLTEAPILVSDEAKIIFGAKEDLKIADIPINSQVHVGGTLSDGKLTATKIIIQKEDADEGKNANKEFEIRGTVKTVNDGNIVVTVSSARKSLNSRRGQDVTIKVTSTTVIEKNEATIVISDIKVSDEVEVEGVIEANDVFIASKIEVKVEEEAGELEGEEEQKGSQGNQGNSNSNRD